MLSLSILSASLFLASLLGCAGLKSRYAMDNEVYAEKYAEGAEKSDVFGKLKQASDARWVENHHGRYFGGGVLVAPDTDSWMGAVGVGHEWYTEPWFSHRVSLDGIVSSSHNQGLYGGVDLGMRAQVPSRLAPFVGAGGMVGLSAFDLVEAAFQDEDDEDDVDWDAMAAVYPEVGVHLWTSGRYRFTVFGRYLITTSGRQHDGWLIGGQLLRF